MRPSLQWQSGTGGTVSERQVLGSAVVSSRTGTTTVTTEAGFSPKQFGQVAVSVALVVEL